MPVYSTPSQLPVATVPRNGQRSSSQQLVTNVVRSVTADQARGNQRRGSRLTVNRGFITRNLAAANQLNPPERAGREGPNDELFEKEVVYQLNGLNIGNSFILDKFVLLVCYVEQMLPQDNSGFLPSLLQELEDHIACHGWWPESE